MSRVISELLVGLSVEVEHYGSHVGINGEVLERIGLVSVRGSARMPLCLESYGIKRILAIIPPLVDVHNDPAALVAIDGLGDGMFSYLLGELLQTVATFGYGQLVFCAHDLRPLDVLDDTSAWFTTVNPKRRYVRSSEIRGSGRLRDRYLREICLGGDRDDLSASTSQVRIDAALCDAGAAVREMRGEPRGEASARTVCWHP